MSKIIQYVDLDDKELENCCSVIKRNCKFVQKSEKKKFGYYFTEHTEKDKKRIIGVELKDEQNIFATCLSYTKNEEKNSFNLTARIPYYIGRLMRESQRKAICAKNKEEYVPLKPPVIKTTIESLTFNGFLREYQKIDCPKIIERMKETGSCYFVADPGYGKTVVMCYVLSQFKTRSLVIVPTVGLAEQSQKELQNRFPFAKISVLGTDCKISDSDIVITYSHRINGRYDIFENFEMIVLDEIHLLTSRVALASVLSTTPKRVLGLTATPGDRDGISQMLVGPQTFRSVYVKKWYLCFPKIFTDLKNNQFGGQKGYTDAITALSKCKPYTEKIMCMLKYFKSLNERIILIPMRVEFREDLAKQIEKEIECSVSVLSKENKECENADIIIGTHKMIGTGFDLNNYVNKFDGKQAGVMIFLGSIKDKTLMHQISGRAFRSELSLAVFPIVQEVSMFKNHESVLRQEVARIKGCRIKDQYGEFLSNLEPSMFQEKKK